MNPVSRLIRYANVWTEFGTIERPTRDSCSLEQIVEGHKVEFLFIDADHSETAELAQHGHHEFLAQPALRGLELLYY